MFICCKIIREPNSKYLKYTIYDTSDKSTEDVLEPDILQVLKKGYPIWGINLQFDKIVVQSQFYFVTKEYFFVNGKDTFVTKFYVKLIQESNGFEVLNTKSYINNNFQTCYFIKDGIFQGKADLIVTQRNGYPVTYDSIQAKLYKGEWLIESEFRYLDKHYYHEDAEEEFVMYHLTYGSNTIDWTDFELAHYASWCKLSDINSDVFVWHKRKIDLSRFIKK